MGAGHAHTLYHHGHTRVHRLAPEVKVATTLAFVTAVALTPREAVWVFLLDAVILATIVAAARLPLRFVFARLAVVIPFVVFAVLIPFVAGGERTELIGVAMSRDGLWSAFNILAKAGLGATASITLAGTTEQARILEGLERLHVPRALTAIAAFMLRYLELLADELGRMRTAMAARGFAPRSLWEARPVATAAGALFIRSYERAERVHAAMLGRGFTGVMPRLDQIHASPGEWLLASWAPALAAAAAVGAAVMS